MQVLYLVRHGETEWNRDRRMQGRRNSALTEGVRTSSICWFRRLAGRAIPRD